MVKAKDNLGEAVVSRLIGRAIEGDTFIKKVRTEGNEQNHCLFYLSLKANQKRIANPIANPIVNPIVNPIANPIEKRNKSI